MQEIIIDDNLKLLLAYDKNDNSDIVQRCVKIWYQLDERIGNDARICLSPVTGLITYNNTDIGFICATSERRYKKGLFLDMAILDKYRNRGIGKSVMERFIFNYNYINEKYLIGETTKDNFAANINGLRLGVIIPVQADYNFYLFSKNKINDFNLDEFANAVGNDEESYAEAMQKIKNR